METSDPHQHHCCFMTETEKSEGSGKILPTLIPGEDISKKRGRRSTSENDAEIERDGEASEAQTSILLKPKSKRGRKHSISYHEEEEEEEEEEEKEEEEDVCFVCFDGGDLILCDVRNCPKVYHAACTGRGSEYFLKKGKWYCGWHVCALCTKKTAIQCYTCPNSFCSNCIGKTNFIPLRKGKGLCQYCIPLITMIEQNLTIDSDGTEVNFNDGGTYECLFKDYWEGLKQKISITWTEIVQACKSIDIGWKLNIVDNGASLDEDNGHNSDMGQLQHLKSKKKLKMTDAILEDTSGSEYEVHNDKEKGEGEGGGEEEEEEEESEEEESEEEEEEEEVEEEEEEDEEGEEEEEEEEGDDDDDEENKSKRGRKKVRQSVGCASKELINFLQEIGEDSERTLSINAAKKLLWSYIETNKLAPEHCGRIRCDEKLQILFQKKYVRKVEITKLLSHHLASKKRMIAKELNQINVDDVELHNNNNKVQKLWKSKKKLEKKLESNSSYYAAIDVKNINLIYLKRRLLEVLCEDPNFESKALGAFVRIRIPTSTNKNGTCYRLVQVTGIKKVQNIQNAAKGGNVVLEILNLQKREEVTLGVVSSQDFTEEECLQLQQCVNSGLLKPMTVGQLEEKARVLRDAKMKDWFENELLRLSNLRDRASEKGRKKELRECIEKIQVLNNPAERERQLKAPIEINVDPHLVRHHEADNPKTSLTNNKGIQSHWDKGLVQNLREMSGTTEASQNGNFVEAHPEKSGQPVKKNKRLDDEAVNAEPNMNNEKNLAKNDDGWDEIVGINEKNEQLDGNSARCRKADRNSLNSKKPHNSENDKDDVPRDKDNEGDWVKVNDNTDNKRSITFKKSDCWRSNTYGITHSINGESKKINYSGEQDDENWKDKHRKSGGQGSFVDSMSNQDVTVPKSNEEDSSHKKLNDISKTANASHTEQSCGWKNSRKSTSQSREGILTDNSKTRHNLKETDAFTASVPSMMEFDEIAEKQRMWHYQDPTKKIHGPFSMEQLRKWEKTKVFPLDLRVWRTAESQEYGILLTDALQGNLYSKVPPGFGGNQVDSPDTCRNILDSRQTGAKGNNLASENCQPRIDGNEWEPRPERDPGVQGTKGEREGVSKGQVKGSILADH